MKVFSHGLLAGTVALSGATAQAAVQFTDWTSATSTTANGTVGAVGVTLSGPVGMGSALGDDSSFFSSSLFSPALALSDHIEIIGVNGTSNYALSFSQAVTNPLLHIFNLASILTFAGINPVKLSGDTHLLVSGNTVSGDNAQGQSSGTLQLTGTFSSINFGMTFPGVDGAYLQVGFEPQAAAAIPEPATSALLLAGLAGLAGIARRRVTR